MSFLREIEKGLLPGFRPGGREPLKEKARSACTAPEFLLTLLLLNFKCRTDMSKNTKQRTPSKREEKQARRVIWGIGIGAIVLMVLIIALTSLW